MNRRLSPTLADYIALAINPVLIMGLIGSLVYFLLEVLYQGIYPQRLHFCLTMFVIAIVLISRISMEEGFARALPFGIAMAVVEALALARFVSYPSGALANYGWIVNWGLMALVWWCAYKLTWDCTELDESQEAGDRGLLETVGIDRPATAAGEAQAADLEKIRQAQRPKRVLNRWEKLLNRPEPGKPHAPGVWVVYFSLASLPIFGLGQLLIPATNTISRRYVFLLLCVYVACGLGLLLTTSFISLRRYLRQRRMEMPPVMAGTWLVTGSAMIVALLLIAACLPRPYPEYAISELSFRGSADERRTSEYAVGQEGDRDAEAQSAQGVEHAPTPPPNPPEGESGQQPGGTTGQASQSSGQTNQSSEQKQASESDQASEGGQSSETGKSSEGSKPSGQSEASKGGQASDQSTSKEQSQSSEGGQQPGEKQSSSEGQPPSSQKSTGEKSAERAQGKSRQTRQQSAQAPKPVHARPASPPPAPPWSLPGVLSMLGLGLIKLLVYGAAIAALGYALWHYRDEVRAFLRQLMASWREFWRSFFGGKSAAQRQRDEPADLSFQHLRTFADFVDPFSGQTAHQFAPKELVKYTFAALEAWASDHGAPKPPDQTPHEFTRQIGAQVPTLAPSALSLADLYCRAVYAQGALPAKNFDQLARLWQLMGTMRPTIIGEDAISQQPT